MEIRSGRAADIHLAPLLILLLFAGEAAAPPSLEKAYRDARNAVDRNAYTEAARLANAALARAGSKQDQWTAALQVLKAEVLARRGQQEKAKALLAPELPPALRKSEAAVWRLIALGMISQGFQKKAYLEEAHKLAGASQPRLLFATHLTLGNATTGSEGDQHLAAAMALARRDGNRLGVAIVNSALLLRLINQERYAEAIDAGEPALATFVHLNAPRVQNVAGNLGWAYSLLGDRERALELFKQAEAAAAREHVVTSQVTWLNAIGNIYFTEERFDLAEKYYSQALRLARELNDRQIPYMLTNLARTALESGRQDDARKFIDEALKAGGTVDQRLRINTLEARLATLGGDDPAAEKILRDVIQRAATATAETRWLAEGELAKLLARMRRNDEAEKQFRRAIETVNDARDSIKGNDANELRLSFFNLATDVFNSYVAFLVRKDRHEDALAVTELIRAKSLEEGLKMPAVARKLDFRAIARQQRATILSYWLDRDRSHLWVVTAGNVTHFYLPPASAIRRAADAYRRDLIGHYGSLERSGARGQELYGMLVEPAGIARGSRVIIVPDDRLYALNFETLVVPAPKPHYWIEDAILSSASSLQLLARNGPATGGGTSMLVVGDPPSADAAFPKLANAQQEIQAVGRHFDRPVVLSGTKATPEGYRAAAPGKFAFLHFVAHGVSSRLRPLDSAVILGRDKSKEYKLYARDIVAQPLDARLVTISSCYGAGERTFAGEGLVGLAWAFLRAGANQVIAALWEVNDSATPSLMDLMYAGIRAGRDPAVALRDAKLALVKGKGSYQNPKYWAPFVLYSGN